MSGEAATKFTDIMTQADQARADLKTAIVDALGTSSVFASMFDEEDREEVAEVLIRQVETFRQREIIVAEADAAREAAQVATATAIENARDKRSVDEVRADRIRQEMKGTPGKPLTSEPNEPTPKKPLKPNKA
jgi:DNA-binding SARP family transcriptional activator